MEDTNRLEELVTKYENTLFRAALAILREPQEAQDAVQDAYVRYLEKRPRFRDGEHAKAWLLKVTANGCKSRLRSRKRHPAVELLDIYPAPDPDSGELVEAILALPADQTPTLGGYEVQEGEMTAYYMLPYIEYGTVEEAGLDLAPPAEVTTQELTQEEVLTLLGGEEAVKVHLGWEDYSLGGHAMVCPDGRLWMLVLGGWKEGADRVSINLTPDQLPPTCLFYMDSVVNHIGDLEVTAERYVGEDSQTLRVSFLTGGYGYRFIAMGTDGQASELLVSRFVRYARDGGLNLDALEGVLAAAAGRA